MDQVDPDPDPVSDPDQCLEQSSVLGEVDILIFLEPCFFLFEDYVTIDRYVMQ